MRKIKKRFGSERTKKLHERIGAGELRDAIVMVLEYYDRGYQHGLSSRDQCRVERVHVEGFNHRVTAQKLVAHQEKREKKEDGTIGML